MYSEKLSHKETPGQPDGLPDKLCGTFKETLLRVEEEEAHPNSVYEASITLTPKPKT